MRTVRSVEGLLAAVLIRSWEAARVRVRSGGS